MTGDENDWYLYAGVGQLALKFQPFAPGTSRLESDSLGRPDACDSGTLSCVSNDSELKVQPTLGVLGWIRTPASSSMMNTTGASAASLMRLGVGRQYEMKRRAASGVACGPQAAAVRLDDRAADGESHARTLNLG